MAGGEGDGLDAVSAENDQLGVGRLAVHDQQVQDWYRGAEDLQFLLQSMCSIRIIDFSYICYMRFYG